MLDAPSKPIVVFTDDGIDKLPHIVDELGAQSHAPTKPQKAVAGNQIAAALAGWLQSTAT